MATLVQYQSLPNDGVFHRALADAEVTAHLWLALLKELECQHGIINPDFELLLTLGKKSKHTVQSFLQGYAAKK
ncbi:hypothetical protein [Aeromonas encheleia]|uniref:hypothetical protein n=1 Tax=Aeromonas encheleia TaxID=73010 RepID=UPI0024142DA2|nr:hypothetical protein [Aeromonas encheleia]